MWRYFLNCWHCSVAVYCRFEIEATLERLKKLERDLSTKEQELKERERRLKMWERKLIDQSNSPVSSSLFPFHLSPPSPSGQRSSGHCISTSLLHCCSHVCFLKTIRSGTEFTFLWGVVETGKRWSENKFCEIRSKGKNTLWEHYG